MEEVILFNKHLIFLLSNKILSLWEQWQAEVACLVLCKKSVWADTTLSCAIWELINAAASHIPIAHGWAAGQRCSVGQFFSWKVGLNQGNFFWQGERGTGTYIPVKSGTKHWLSNTSIHLNDGDQDSAQRSELGRATTKTYECHVLEIDPPATLGLDKGVSLSDSQYIFWKVSSHIKQVWFCIT